jgi:hypothetical protein
MVSVMAAGGIDQAKIAGVLGICKPTLRKYFRHELDAAALEAHASVIASLLWMATKGKNVAAAIWWTKSRLGWRERIVVNGEGDAFGFTTLVNVIEQRRKELPEAPASGD